MVREHHIDHLNHQEMGLYLFLVTVADANGLSFYGEASIMKRLGMSANQLELARDGLIQNNLIAFRKPLYQVLALPDSPSRSIPSGSASITMPN